MASIPSVRILRPKPLHRATWLLVIRPAAAARLAASALLSLPLPSLVRPALASSPAAWAALDVQVRATCRAASTLAAVVEPGDRLDLPDRDLSLLLLEGRYRQPHLQGQRGMELCVYERSSGRASVVEADALFRSRVNPAVNPVVNPAPASPPADRPGGPAPARP